MTMTKAKIVTLYEDKEKALPILPITKTKAVSDEDGNTVDALFQMVPYHSEINQDITIAPLNAERLNGKEEKDLNVATAKNAETLNNKTIEDIIHIWPFTGAGPANGIVQEYSLGDHLTQEQSEDIRSGNFRLVHVGGYWTINGRKYWAAHADYRLNTGKSPLKYHHMLIVPDKCFQIGYMNAEDTTGQRGNGEGGYHGCDRKHYGMGNIINLIHEDFGSEHIVPYGCYMSNAGFESHGGGAYYDAEIVDLMNEHMVYGSSVMGKCHWPDTGMDKTQLALFRARPDLIITGTEGWWMRDIVSERDFAVVNYVGLPNSAHASDTNGIRPAFLIY